MSNDLLARVVPRPHSFSSRLRSPTVAARLGVVLGVCFVVCFLTGLVSHYAQSRDQPVTFPASPAWGYQVTQGLHVITGTASIPLLLIKLWSVLPNLFEPVRFSRARAVTLNLAERASIAALVGASIFLLTSGLLNTAQWYPWSFSFRTSHYAAAWIAIGGLLIHIAVKLPLTTELLSRDVDDTTHDRATTVADPSATTTAAGLSRRGLLRTAWATSALVVLATAGSTVPLLRKISVFAVRSGEGPQGIPINKSAAAARVTQTATAASWVLEVAAGARSLRLTRADLGALDQYDESLPIACVEGWSATGTWGGVRLRDVLDLVDAPRGSAVRVESLQDSGPFRTTVLQGNFADDDRTLLALRLGGEDLSLDHGFPVRLIAPNRPGVLQTKWLARLEVQA